MATPLQVAQSVVDTVPSLTNLQRLRIRNQWTLAWDAHVASRELTGFGADAYLKAGWYVHHEALRALNRNRVEWTTLAERARARWEGDTERDPRAEIWTTAQRFVVRDTIRAVLARDSDIDSTVYALLTAAWRDRFPGLDA
ncbi:MAG: hypothetical protein R2761_16305 [Acidimicrobiales bacterium]